MHSDKPESDETFDIYFLVKGDDDFLFYRIPDDQPPPSETGAMFLAPVSKDAYDESDQEFLQPVLKRQGKWRSAGCAAAGTTIYLFGGESEGPYGRRDMKKELHYFDMRHPEIGWKQGCPMQNPRSNPTGFSVNNKIYVVGGFDLDNISTPLPIEVYSPEDDSWETKCELFNYIDESSVYDNNGGKQVLMFTSHRELLIYSVECGNWGLCTRPKSDCRNYDGLYPHTMTVLGDETLFMGCFGYSGYEIIGYDFLNNKGCCPVKVTGLEDLMEYRSDYLLPRFSSSSSTLMLLAIGKKKLALVWTEEKIYHFYVNCLKMEIDREDIGPNEMTLTAHSGSFSSHIVKGYRIECCFLLERSEEGPEDQSKLKNHGGYDEDELKPHRDSDEHIK